MDGNEGWGERDRVVFGRAAGPVSDRCYVDQPWPISPGGSRSMIVIISEWDTVRDSPQAAIQI
jgi:hypothetical protein